MPYVMPLGASTVPNHPGRRPPLSVPFSGRGGRGEHSGRRRAPMPRPKLTKVQKKALKWSRKHPEPEGSRGVLYNQLLAATSSAATTVNVNFSENLRGYLGQPATQETLAQISNAVRVWVINAENQGLFTPTATYTPTTPSTSFWTGNNDTTAGVNIIPSTAVTFSTASATTATITLPMSWTDWNREWYTPASRPATGWEVRRHNHYATDPAWSQWQGRGNADDLWYDPNDQLQKQRLRREREIIREAEAAESRRRWEAEAPERERRRLAELERQRVENQQREQQRQTALKRSYELLFRHLTDEQKNMLETENRFLITAQSGRLYEIRRGTMHNIFRLDDQGRAVEELCCYIPGVPEGDNLLGQMLHLMTNEDEFCRGSNRWELRDMNQVDRRLPLTGRVRPSEAGRILLPRQPAPVIAQPQQRAA